MAAGTSERLKPLTDEIPKTLLRLGEKTILEHILDTARSEGLQHFDIVTGHGHRAIEEFVREYQQRHPKIHITLIYNDLYDSTGNIVSLLKAQEVFDEDFILINSDTVFHADILKKLLAEKNTNAMIVDDVKHLGAEEMKVLVDQQEHIIRIHKSLDPRTSHGEYVGLLKLGKQVKQQLLASLEKRIAEDESVYYEDAIQTMIDDHGVPIQRISTEGLPVMEIDTPEDLRDAENLIKQIACPSS